MRNKREHGITLIALIITIIILLILSGIAINLVTRDNSVISKAIKASEKSTIETIKEEMSLALANWYADYYDEGVELEGRNTTTSSGANLVYEEDFLIYTTKSGYVYQGILVNGKVDDVEKVGKNPVVNYEWALDVPTDSWFSNESYYDVEWEGNGSEDSPYLISSKEELAGLSYKVANGEVFESTYFKLTKNLRMEEHIWIPIGRTYL